MKKYNQPKVDFISMEVKNDICVSLGINAASPAPTGTGIKIGGSGKVTSD